MKLKPTTTIKPYRDDVTIRNIILNLAQKKGQVVYGQQAVNVQLPKRFQRKTIDYDIYTKKPEQSARELLKELKKEYKNGKFKVVKGTNPKTWKVKKGKKTIADYTGTTKKPGYKKVLGVSYAKLKYQKGRLGKLVKRKEFEYRREKDIDTLEKIKQGEMRDFLMS